MNKNLFFKLVLVLLVSLSLVSCGQKSNLTEEDNSYNVKASNSINNTENSGEEGIKTIDPPVEDADKVRQDNKDAIKDKQEDSQQDMQKETEDKYYSIIKEAWKKQKDYIDSIDDPKVKQSVQTSLSAAVMESERLLLEHPDDSESINASLKRVLNGD